MDELLSIGELAHRTGVPVRTIRFWSDTGVLPEAGRTATGQRRFDAATVARLELVRTLRDLGLGLDEVRAVLIRRHTIPEVAADHIHAIDARMADLRVQRAVCTLLARGEPDERTTILINDLARLSAGQRQQMIDEFVDATFAGTDPDAPAATVAATMRTVALPDEPSTEQLAAWVELADLVQDPSFRARIREMAIAGARANQAGADAASLGFDPALVAEHAGVAQEGGVHPGSTRARSVLERIGAGALDEQTRSRIAGVVETFTDLRVERYWALLARLNGWPTRPSPAPAFLWFAAALRGPAR